MFVQVNIKVTDANYTSEGSVAHINVFSLASYLMSGLYS